MTDPSLMSSTGLYAVKLVVDPSDPARLAGRLEHVLSGRLHDFDDGASLLRMLVREQTQGYSIESRRPGASS